MATRSGNKNGGNVGNSGDGNNSVRDNNPSPQSNNNENNNSNNNNNGNNNSDVQLMMLSMMKNMQEQNAHVLQQLSSYQQQQLQLQQQQVSQQQLMSKQSLARTDAGPAPTLSGLTRDINPHRWKIALTNWFRVAQITEESEKLLIAQSRLTDTAQQWWATQQLNGKAMEYDTWEKFSAAVMVQFLPQDVSDWARDGIQKLVAVSMKNVITYTEQYDELNQVIEDSSEKDRIRKYEDGLPEEYRIKSRESKHKQLKEAMDAAVTRYKVRNTSSSSSMAFNFFLCAFHRAFHA
jgi:hypothetical protein